MFTRLKRFDKSDKIIFCLFFIFIIGFAVIATIYKINIHLDLDSYDEGVYWQTLIAIQHNLKLYSQIFYSQPPAFIWLIYPFFTLLGKSIAAARLGIFFYSLVGLISAFFIGKTVLNKWLGLVLAGLLAFNFLFIKESQILQAEMPMLALGLVSYALALCYWNTKTVRKSFYYILFSLAFLILAIFTKLLAAALIIPLAIIILNKLVKTWNISRESFRVELWIIAKAVSLGLLLVLIILLPYVHNLPDLYSQVVQFHLDAKEIFVAKSQVNLSIIASFILNNVYLFILAILGIISGSIRRNKYLLPTFIWFVALLILLVLQKPLFYHHTTVFLAPLVILAILPFSLGKDNLGKTINAISLVLVGLVVVGNTQRILNYKINLNINNSNTINMNNELVRDLAIHTKPGDFIITDNQFVAGLAKRRVLPNLVDTSTVRARSGYLTTNQLNNSLLDPRIKGVLFSNNKLNGIIDQKTKEILNQNFYLSRSPLKGIQLWYKKV